MTEQEQIRFDFLRQGPCVPPRYIRDFYGLPWPFPSDLRTAFEAWQGTQRRRTSCGAGRVSRVELESFMHNKAVIPRKWMAARLGMQVASLDELLEHLDEIGMRLQRYVVYPDLIAESFSEDLVLNLPGLKFRTFSDHNTFCQRLHADLNKQPVGLVVRPLFCATSDRMGDYPRLFASTFDCLTLLPLSGKHQVWLDFHKPIKLGPDRCSKLFYVENREGLREYCAGTYEPDDLDVYSHFLAGQADG